MLLTPDIAHIHSPRIDLALFWWKNILFGNNRLPILIKKIHHFLFTFCDQFFDRWVFVGCIIEIRWGTTFAIYGISIHIHQTLFKRCTRQTKFVFLFVGIKKLSEIELPFLDFVGQLFCECNIAIFFYSYFLISLRIHTCK